MTLKNQKIGPKFKDVLFNFPSPICENMFIESCLENKLLKNDEVETFCAFQGK